MRFGYKEEDMTSVWATIRTSLVQKVSDVRKSIKRKSIEQATAQQSNSDRQNTSNIERANIDNNKVDGYQHEWSDKLC